MDFKPVGFKVTVHQSWDVYIYYPEGLVIEAPEGEEVLEIERIAIENALDIVFEDDGLVIREYDETETSNGFIAYVEEFDPDVDIEYTIRQIPKQIVKAIDAAQKAKNDKDD